MAIVKGKFINAHEIALPFRHKIAETIGNYKSAILGPPKLVGLLANDDLSAKKYAQWTAQACQKDGIEYELREMKREQLEYSLKEANMDPKIHGIIIYYPVFGKLPHFMGGTVDEFICNSVSKEKDVEGMCYE